jgi:hypothetical protein
MPLERHLGVKAVTQEVSAHCTLHLILHHLLMVEALVGWMVLLMGIQIALAVAC